MKELIVHYQQDPETSFWTVTVPDVPMIVTQGKTLSKAFQCVKNALALVYQGPAYKMRGRSVWTSNPHLSAEDLEVVRACVDLRIFQLEINSELEVATCQAVQQLRKNRRRTLRQTGQLMGLTHQRIEQIIKSSNQSKD